MRSVWTTSALLPCRGARVVRWGKRVPTWAAKPASGQEAAEGASAKKQVAKKKRSTPSRRSRGRADEEDAFQQAAEAARSGGAPGHGGTGCTGDDAGRGTRRSCVRCAKRNGTCSGPTIGGGEQGDCPPELIPGAEGAQVSRIGPASASSRHATVDCGIRTQA